MSAWACRHPPIPALQAATSSPSTLAGHWGRCHLCPHPDLTTPRPADMRPYRHPQVDADSLCVLQDAIQTLAIVRGLDCPLTDPGHPYDPADVLRLL
jgi:hypothetical protein